METKVGLNIKIICLSAIIIFKCNTSYASMHHFDIGFQIKVSIDDNFAAPLKSKIIDSFEIFTNFVRDYTSNPQNFIDIDACVLERTKKLWLPDFRNDTKPINFSQSLIYSKPNYNPIMGIKKFFNLINEYGLTFQINAENLIIGVIVSTENAGQVYPFSRYHPHLFSISATTTQLSGRPYLEKVSNGKLAGIFLRELMHVIGYINNGPVKGSLSEEVGNCFGYFNENRLEEIYHKDFLAWCKDDELIEQQRYTTNILKNHINKNDCQASATALNNINELDLSFTDLNNIDVLSSLRNLKKLNLSHTSIANLKPLSSLTTITDLDISETKINTLDFIKSFSHLRKLTAINTLLKENQLDSLRLEMPASLIISSQFSTCGYFENSNFSKQNCKYIFESRHHGNTYEQKTFNIIVNGRSKVEVCRHDKKITNITVQCMPLEEEVEMPRLPEFQISITKKNHSYDIICDSAGSIRASNKALKLEVSSRATSRNILLARQEVTLIFNTSNINYNYFENRLDNLNMQVRGIAKNISCQPWIQPMLEN